MDPSSNKDDGGVSFREFKRNLEVESTPRRPRTKPDSFKFICAKKTRAAQQTPAVDDTQPIDLSVNDLTFSQLAPADDEQHPSSLFRVPAPPPSKKKKKTNAKTKPTLICTYCLKPYVRTRSFQAHNRMHVMQDAARIFPDQKKILDNIEAISATALTSVSNCISHGTNGQKFKELVGHLAVQPKFVDFSELVAKELLVALDSKVVLPSALMSNLGDKMEEILSNSDLCSSLLSILNLSEFHPNTQSQFLLEFMLNFTLEIFRYIYRSNYRPNEGAVVSELDLEQKQVIFYIAGSIMRGYLRIAKRYSSNVKWQTIASVLKTKVLCEIPEGEINIEAQWTSDVDRGGLLYIFPPVQEFFKKVASVILESEKFDGSINYEEVIEKVTKSNISVDWDQIISDALPEKLSLNLVNDVITMFSKICGRGITKRRLNRLRNKNPLISMAMRVSVARRKKK
ncbi:Formamidopyrimidine-DNA glycosylase [Frankliniella fusca]|uniref:Formamidopyrimidine-DNA glycosylase n=1 Tax=Frankliniella fusca TaxID=407009 RepID=A0AAE1H1I7_9NEOP|nr:Formamidopyrimidine-DNA glycosylase [Frankliniella fusca]